MSYEDEAKFYTQLAKLEKERDAAFKTRKKDPERWRKAKQAYAEFRSGIRAAAEIGA